MSGASWQRFLRELAEEHGAAVEITRGNHMAIVHPSGWRVVCSATPGDHRAKLNVRAEVRRFARGQRRRGIQV